MIVWCISNCVDNLNLPMHPEMVPVINTSIVLTAICTNIVDHSSIRFFYICFLFLLRAFLLNFGTKSYKILFPFQSRHRIAKVAFSVSLEKK